MKTKTFYVVWTTDDERSGSIKAYCETRELAVKRLKKERDFFLHAHQNQTKTTF